MIALPPALARWHDELRLFDPAIVATLGPLVQRLDAAIGPLRTHREAPGLDVDGYDGLTRRGEYERLLMSEWLLAEEAPEEFLRRAAGAEHSFLAFARREPAGSPRSVIIFDAGPGQLGSPRIAHLALLIVMARRALKANASFEWFTAQNLQWNSTKVEASPTLTEDGVRTLLRASSLEEADPDHLASAAAHFAEQKTDDVWFVGERKPERWTGSYVLIEEPVEPGVHALRVAVKHRRGATKSVTLELPESRQSIRIFRDPFRRVAPPPVPKNDRKLKVSPTSNIVFGVNGRHVFVQLADGTVACFALNMNAVESTAGPKLVLPPKGGQLLGVGRHGRLKVSVSLVGNTLFFQGWRDSQNRDISRALEPREVEAVRKGDDLGACFIVHHQGENRFVLRRDGRIFVFICRGNGEVHFGAWNLPVVADYFDTPRYVAVCDHGQRYFHVDPPGQQPRTSIDIDTTPDRPAFFGYRGHGKAYPARVLLAVQQRESLWQVSEHDMTAIEVPPDTRVFGAARVEERWNYPILLAIQDRSAVVALTVESPAYLLFRDRNEIAYAAVSPYSNVLAYITTAGDFVVYSLERNQVILRREATRSI